MECTLATLIACFSWSSLYIDSGLAYQNRGELWRAYHHETDSEPFKKLNWKRNPYGRFGLGYELNFRSVQWSIEATHTSSIATDDDDGLNAISLNARWYPFR